MTMRWMKLKFVMAAMIIIWCLLAAGGMWLLTADRPFMLPWNHAAHQENSILREQIRTTASGMQSVEVSLLRIYDADAHLTLLLGTRLTAADSLARLRTFHDPVLKQTVSSIP